MDFDLESGLNLEPMSRQPILVVNSSNLLLKTQYFTGPDPEDEPWS